MSMLCPQNGWWTEFPMSSMSTKESQVRIHKLEMASTLGVLGHSVM